MGDFHLLFFASFLAHSVPGQNRKSVVVADMSAIPLIATKLRTSLEVRFVPMGDISMLFNSLDSLATRTGEM